ncbi:MAG: hypothetical protein L3J54_13515, partial [Draconibacterium sp.]|nr:hypothetical protein [Draconibacterium sp.]
FDQKTKSQKIYLHICFTTTLHTLKTQGVAPFNNLSVIQIDLLSFTLCVLLCVQNKKDLQK